MGFCTLCKDFLPPDFMMVGKKKCHFCDRESNTIVSPDGKLWNKGDVVQDYKIFLDNLKENATIQQEIAKSITGLDREE